MSVMYGTRVPMCAKCGKVCVAQLDSGAVLLLVYSDREEYEGVGCDFGVEVGSPDTDPFLAR